MKYEKPEADVVAFDFSEFMTGSGSTIPMYCTGYSDGHGHTCGNYTEGTSCMDFTSTSFGNATCRNYDGKKCYAYSDGTHSNCTEYGYSCGSF